MYLPVGEISRHYVAPAFQPAERLSPMCAKLLFGYQGLLDVNSSSPDQPALCIPKLGGLFSMTLSLPYDDQILDELFQDEIRKGSRLGRTIQAIDFAPGLLFSADNQARTWDEVLNYCQNELNGRFRPVYKSLNVTQTIARNQMPTPAAIPADVKRAQAGTGPAQPGGGQRPPGGGQWQPGGHGQPGGGHGGGQPGPRRIAPGTVVTLSPGDVILSINGRRIGGTRDFWNAVKASPEIMQFTLQSSGDGQVYRLKARLFNVTRDSRFGVVGEAIPGRAGVRVRSIRRGYPGARSVIVE